MKIVSSTPFGKIVKRDFRCLLRCLLIFNRADNICIYLTVGLVHYMGQLFLLLEEIIELSQQNSGSLLMQLRMKVSV